MNDSPVVLALKLAESTVGSALALTPSKCSAVLSAMRLHLPYVWWESGPALLLCGREYQPVAGAGVGAAWHTHDFQHLKVDPALIAPIPGMKRQSGPSAWFYHDGNAPWHGKDYAEAYHHLLQANIKALEDAA